MPTRAALPALLLHSLLGLATAAGAVTFDNGMVNVVDTPLGEGAIVSDGPGGSQTTLQLQPGGVIGTGFFADDLVSLGNSRIEVSGGQVDGLAALRDTSDFQSTGGAVGFLQASDDTTLAIDGGSYGDISLGGNSVTHWTAGGAFDSASVTDNAELTVNGVTAGVTEFGFFASGQAHLELIDGGASNGGLIVSGSATANVFPSSSLGGFRARDSASVVFMGGQVGNGSHFPGFSLEGSAKVRVIDITYNTSQQLNVNDTSVLTIEGGQGWDCLPGCFAGFSANDDGLIRVAGSGFNFPFGDLVPTAGILTGLLADGSPIDFPFARQGNGRIVLVPEPATGLLLGAGLAGLCARRRGWALSPAA